MSINNLIRWIYFAAVPLALLAGSTIAVLLALYGFPDSEKGAVPVPIFNFATTKSDGTQKHQFSYKPQDTGTRNIFETERKEQIGKELLELHEIALGLVIVKKDTRLCMTNGVAYMEGQDGTGFTVSKIEQHGVWYEIGGKMVFLKTGTKIHVDVEGNIHEPEVNQQ